MTLTPAACPGAVLGFCAGTVAVVAGLLALGVAGAGERAGAGACRPGGLGGAWAPAGHAATSANAASQIRIAMVPSRADHYMQGKAPGREHIGRAGNGNLPGGARAERGFESLRARAIDRRQLRTGVTSRRLGRLAGPGRPVFTRRTRESWPWQDR